MNAKILSLPILFAFLAALMISAPAAQGQSTNRKIGNKTTATADPLVPRPNEKPCIVPLFSKLQFAFFSQTDQNFSFRPPARCAGPWQKVILDINFNENAGRQFDRTASLYIANTDLYFGTTPEPLRSSPNHWHIERDITDYSALLRTDQQGTMVLQNCTTDCPPPFNTELTGVFTVSAQLEFYPTQADNFAPRTADMVLPLVQPNGSGGFNLPVILSSPSDQLSTAFNLPTNIEQVYLDVVSQSQSTDEQWYGCFPNDLSSINEVYGCGNTDFRETEVTIDGQPAGIAPVSPWVYTGFLPDQWAPIPAVQTLDFVPYRVNLTPFAGVLSDGKPHTVAISVFNDDNYFSTTASLLLFLDHGSSNVSGKVFQNTLQAPSPTVTENLQGTSTVTGDIDVHQRRAFTIAGFIDTSHGRVTTSVSQEQNFSSTQAIDFDTVNASVLDQKTTVQNSVNSLTTSFGRGGFDVSSQSFSFPITVDFIFPVSSARFGFTVATTQKYQASKLRLHNGRIEDFSTVSNSATASDASPIMSSQHYTSFNLGSRPYNCEIASENNVLTKISAGCGH
ncbi:MAG TPA: peptide-N4-asparagine amidase [Terriglobales bacterium]|nr:peptide-N4-asparagine amidase [Terriglobales bacterium]